MQALVACEKKMENISYRIGVFCGIFFGVVIIGIITRLCRKDKKLWSVYDERQQIARGKAYKYGFFTFLFELVYLMVIAPTLTAYISMNIQCFLALVIGVLVYAIYCILNEAYFGVNDTMTKWSLMFGLIGAFNLIIGFIAFFEHEPNLAEDYPNGLTNIICGFMMVICFATVMIKAQLNKREED